MRRRLVVVCVFSPQKLDERSVVSKKKRKNITHVRVVSRDVVKTVTGRRKKMQKKHPTQRKSLSVLCQHHHHRPYKCALVSEAPAEEKNHVSLFTQTPKFTREERHDETLIWSKEDRRSAFVGGHDE